MKKLILTNSIKIVLIDDEDYELISKYNWYLAGGYAATRIGDDACVKMHQLILGSFVDHKNRNKLDNRRTNLRFATGTQNNANRGKVGKSPTSQFKGVYLTEKGKWKATITIKYKSRHLGYFATELEAAIVYDIAAQELFGEFALLNFPS